MTDASSPVPGLAVGDPGLGAIEQRLAAVEGALSRIEGGSYGRCGACGRPVPDEELAEDPLAVLCGECTTGPGAVG